MRFKSPPAFTRNRVKYIFLPLAAALALVSSILSAAAGLQTFEVATNGTAQGPVFSFSAALEQSRRVRGRNTDKIRLRLHTGTYLLTEPLLLTGKDSGLLIEACRRESPVFSSQTAIHGWKRSLSNPNVWQTQIAGVRDGNWVFHELFVNGRRKQRTRLPEHGFFHMAGPGIPNRPTEFSFHAGDIRPEWAQSGDVELIAYLAWAQSRNQIREVFASSHIVSLAGDALPNTSESDARYYIENAPIPLQPGQWHLNLATGLLTYWPEAGEDILNASITAPCLYDLVQIKGTPLQPARDIVFRGIGFADTDWPLAGGTDMDPQAAVEIPAAVQAEFARDCAFEQCVFQRLGGYALQLNRGCEMDKIIGNEMTDLGAGGIRVGEMNPADATPFPCGHHTITDNHIHDIGLVSAPAVGIFILLSSHNEIAHNEVDHTYYTAISVGWSWGYGETTCCGNIVEFNHLHDIGQGMLSDMGGIYTLGRQPGAIIRNNLIHDVNIYRYGGWGLYTDEGSTGIVLENNIVYRCQNAGFHQHYGLANIVRNNIIALNSNNQLMRTRTETHISFIFTNNIVYFDTGWLLGGNWNDDLEMDHNIYFDTRSKAGDTRTLQLLQAWQKRGHDQHTLFIDPLFVAPRQENFQLQPQSPALRLGFHPIDLRDVGIRPKYRRQPLLLR
jgi:hypothetical protein